MRTTTNMGTVAFAAALALLATAPHEAAAACAGNGPLHDLGILGISAPAANVEPDPSVLFSRAPRVLQVADGSSAFGKLREGDLLVSIDGHAITSPDAARHYAGIRPGDEVRLTVKRRDTLRGATVVAGQRCPTR
jgi:S1-C subfamily serine protease